MSSSESIVNYEIKSVTKGVSISFVGQISIISLNILFQFLSAKFLGAKSIGLLAIIISISSIATTFAVFGVNHSVLRYTAFYLGQGNKQRASGVIIAGAGIVIVTSLICCIVLSSFANYIGTKIYKQADLVLLIQILAVSIPFSTLMIIAIAVLQAFKRIAYQVVIGQIIAPLLKVFSLLFVVFATTNILVNIVWSIVVVSISSCIFSLIAVWYCSPFRWQSIQPTIQFKDMIAFSWPLLLTDFAYKSLQEVQIIVLGTLIIGRDLGFYYIGLRLASLLTVFLNSFSTIFAPIIAESYGQNNLEQVEKLFKILTKWGVILSLPPFVFLLIYSKEIMNFLGPEFGSSALILQILVCSQIFNVGTGSIGLVLIMSGHSYLNLLITILASALNILLILLLTMYYGVVGAAVGSALGLFLVNIFGLYLVYRVLHIHPYNAGYIKPITAIIAGCSVVVPLHTRFSESPILAQMLISLVVLLTIYGAILLLLKLDETDEVILQQLLRRCGIRKFGKTYDS